jgi:hypothetical protein
VCTGLGIFPEPELSPFTKPPGTNFLATIYTNMFDGKGNEMPNTLPSTPTIPYNLHDGPPVVSQINPASPTTDLSSVFVLVARKACQNLSPLPPALAQYCNETEDLARDQANALKEVAATLLGVRDIPDGPPESIIDAIMQQMSLEKTTQTGLDILEGNPLEPRAYSGLPLLHYKGPDKIKKVTRTTDKDGHPIGTVNVHQVWYDSHIESDTAFIDQSEAMDIPWTITYTVDVLSRGNDDFSPFVMYFDAPGNENPWMPGLPHIGMDQTFFPMEDGTRNVFKIKMTLGKYQNLIYTWGWRIHPTRVQVIEGALKHYSYQGSDPKFKGQSLSLPEWEMMVFGGRTPEQIAKFGQKTKEQAIAMIGEASPAKVMWTDLREAQEAARQGDYRRVVARMIEAQDAFGDWRDRTQLPQGALLFVTASEASFITQLDQETFPDGLRQRFEASRILLSNPVTVSVVDRGLAWLITDANGLRYTVKLEEKQLNIYRGVYRGVNVDKSADLTLLYVNNTIFAQFTDGGRSDYPKWQLRGTPLNVTLLNGDYFEHAYQNVDFGGNRGWENQFKSSVKVGGSGCWFTFGRAHWWMNIPDVADPAPSQSKHPNVLVPAATRSPYQPSALRVNLTYNFEPSRRLRFYQFDPVHHDVAVYSVH